MQRLANFHAALHYSNANAANDIHQRNDDARDGISAHKLAGTIHRTVEIRFLGELIAPSAGRLFLDEACVEFGIDRHLLAGHGIQSKSCRHLRNAAGALGDDHEVDHGEDDKHHKTHHVIILHHHFTELLNDLAGLRFTQN